MGIIVNYNINVSLIMIEIKNIVRGGDIRILIVFAYVRIVSHFGMGSNV
jgi:hypothetical protein